MKTKKLLVLLLALHVMFVLAACDNVGSEKNVPNVNNKEKTDAPAVEYTDEAKDFTVGFLGYIYSTGQDASIKGYVDNVLLPNLPNVNAIYSMAFNNIEDEKKAIENLITQGVDGIIVTGFYDFVGLMETCADAGVYVACAVYEPNPSDMEIIIGDSDVMEYYLGFVGQSIESEYEAGIRTAQAAMELAPSGDIAVFGMQGYVEDSFQYQRLEGVFTGLGDRYNESLFFKIDWDDSVVMTLASDVLATNPSAVATTTAGADLLCGTIAMRKATETTQVAAIGYIGKTYRTYFANGSLDHCESIYGEQSSGAFVLMYNWLNNGLRWKSPGHDAVWLEVPYVSIPDFETIEAWMEYCGTIENSPFTFNDVQQLLVQFNHDATYEEFATLMQAVSLEEVRARRG